MRAGQGGLVEAQPPPTHPWGKGIADAAQFSAATERALAHGEDRAIVLVELHGAPDAVVAAAESRLLRAVRPGDLIGGLGDDRFAVLAETSGGRVAAAGVTQSLSRRIAARLSEPFHVGGETVQLSPRVGVAFAHGDADTAAKLLLRAEQALETPPG
jgi:GGDEF domain-containing protein